MVFESETSVKSATQVQYVGLFWNGGQGQLYQVRGPIGSTFAGSHPVTCAETFEEEHQVIMIEIRDVKDRGPKWLLPPVSVSPLQTRRQRHNTQ